MIGTDCPSCGKTVPLSLATPDTFRCVSCRAQGPLPAETAARMRAAVETLWAADVRHRQLTHAQKRQLRSTWLYRFAFLGFYGGFAVLFGSCAYCMTRHTVTETGVDWLTILTFVGPLAFFLVTGALLYSWIGRRTRSLENACAANPPAVPGVPATCHVCGADLPTAVRDPVVACGFCRADNVVSPEVLERVRKGRAIVLDAFSDEVRVHAAGVGATAGRAMALVLPAAIAAPVVTVLFVLFLLVGSAFFTAAPDLAIEYTAVRTPVGLCIARVRRHPDGRILLDFGSSPDRPSDETVLPSAQGLAILRAPDLVGRVVRMQDGATARVLGAVQMALDVDDNYLEVTTTTGARTGRYVRGTCFADVP